MIRRVSLISLMLAVLVGGSALAAIDPETKVSLTFDDTPIAAILKMLAEQNHLNLVVPTAVDESELPAPGTSVLDAILAEQAKGQPKGEGADGSGDGGAA